MRDMAAVCFADNVCEFVMQVLIIVNTVLEAQLP